MFVINEKSKFKDFFLYLKNNFGVTLHFISNNKLHMDSLLSTINNNTEGLVVLIKPLGSSKYSNLVDVLDALNYSNIQRYAISDLSEFDESLELNSRSDE